MKLKNLIVSVTVFALTISASIAQTSSSGSSSGGGTTVSTPAKEIPVAALRSTDMLREAALGTVVRGSRGVSGTTIDTSFEGTFVHTNVTGVSAEDILGKLFSVKFKYRVMNPKDELQGYVYLYDANNNLVFYGYSNYSGESPKPQFGIWFYRAPVLSGVKSAELLALTEDGQTARRTQVTVSEGGQVLFEAYAAGAVNGLLAVKYKNGEVATFRLDNPVAQTPGVTTDENQTWKVDYHYTLATEGKPATLKIIETWGRPTALVTSSDLVEISLDVVGLVNANGGTFFERPSAVFVTGLDGVPVRMVLEGSSPKIALKGTYRLRFEWNMFGRPTTLYTGPADDKKG